MRHKWTDTTDGQTQHELCVCGMKRVCSQAGPKYFTWKWQPTKAGQCYGAGLTAPDDNAVALGARAE